MLLLSPTSRVRSPPSSPAGPSTPLLAPRGTPSACKRLCWLPELPLAIVGAGMEISELQWVGSAMAGADGIVYDEPGPKDVPHTFQIRDITLRAVVDPAAPTLGGAAVWVAWAAPVSGDDPTILANRVKVDVVKQWGVAAVRRRPLRCFHHEDRHFLRSSSSKHHRLRTR